MKRLFLILLFLLVTVPAYAMPYDYYLGTEDEPDFYVPLIYTTVATKCGTAGGCTPTFTRATTAYVKDFEGLYKQVKSGEVRFRGARRVENLVSTKSEDFSNAAWTKSNMNATATTLTATAGNATVLQTFTNTVSEDYRLMVTMSRITGTGNIDLTLDGGSTWTTVTLTGSNQDFSIAKTGVTSPQFGIRIVTSGDAINATQIQVTKTTGQSNTNPSEYVSVGVLSSPFHGAMVDGVKYFTTENSCTVTSNVVTGCGAGAAIADATLEGYLAESARENKVLQNRQFDTTWTLNNTPLLSQNQTGIDGQANKAWTITDDAASSEGIYQIVSIPNDSNTHSFSVYVKKDTNQTRFVEMLMNLINGSGVASAVQFNTQTGASAIRTGTANPVVTVTSENSTWWKFNITATNNSSGNTSMGVYLYPARGVTIGVLSDAATGSAVFDQAQVELNASLPTSPIPTTTVAVSRNADVMTFPSAGNVDGTKGTAFATAAGVAPPTGTNAYVIDLGTYSPPLARNATPVLYLRDSTSSHLGNSWTGTARTKVGARWGGSASQLVKAGVLATATGFDGDMNVTQIRIGADGIGTAQFNGTIRDIKIYKRELSNAVMQRLTQ